MSIDALDYSYGAAMTNISGNKLKNWKIWIIAIFPLPFPFRRSALFLGASASVHEGFYCLFVV